MVVREGHEIKFPEAARSGQAAHRFLVSVAPAGGVDVVVLSEVVEVLNQTAAETDLGHMV